MTIRNLKELYLEQIQDLHSASRQAYAVTRALYGVARDADLKDVLEEAFHRTDAAINTLAELAERHVTNPDAAPSRAIAGLVEVGVAKAIDRDYSRSHLRDGVIIAQYQGLFHYEISAYDCLVANAKRLDFSEDSQWLETSLSAARESARVVSDLARGGGGARAAA